MGRDSWCPTESVSALEQLSTVFVRANGYALAKSLGVSTEVISISGPGAFGGPYVGSAQALLVLAAYLAAFVGLAAIVLRRRDVT